MSEKRQILIAVDGSQDSFTATSYVAKTCHPANIRVSLMHVMPTAPETFWDLGKADYFKVETGSHFTIVMGRRGLSKVREFLLGRVTNKVLQRTENFAVWDVP